MGPGQHTARLRSGRTSSASHIWPVCQPYTSGYTYARPCCRRRAYRLALATSSLTAEHLEACRAGHDGVVHVDAAVHKFDCAILGHLCHRCEARSAGEGVKGEITGGPMIVNDAPACAMTSVSHSSDWYRAANISSGVLQGKVNRTFCMWRQWQEHLRPPPGQPKCLHHAKQQSQQIECMLLRPSPGQSILSR